MLIGGIISASAQKTIVDVAVGSSAHTTLVAAVKAADLVATLQSAGPFTVFAPTNDAFAKLPATTWYVKILAKVALFSGFKRLSTVPFGNLDAAAVLKAIKDGNGSVTLKAVSGGTLTASIKGGKVILTDEKGGIATVTATDLKAGNGVIHVIDAVVLPK